MSEYRKIPCGSKPSNATIEVVKLLSKYSACAPVNN